jgi:hypothetical protein
MAHRTRSGVTCGLSDQSVAASHDGSLAPRVNDGIGAQWLAAPTDEHAIDDHLAAITCSLDRNRGVVTQSHNLDTCRLTSLQNGGGR